MIETKALSSEEVIAGLKKCIKIDHENGAEMVAYIEEVDRRRLYFDHGHGNLFSFLTKGLGLSNASAQLRIDSARLMTAVPEIRHDLSEGSLNLSQLAFVAQAIRQKKKESPGFAATSLVKRGLIEKVKEAQDMKMVQQVVSKELDLEIRARESKRVQKDESVSMHIQFSKEQMQIIERAKELLAHVDPNPNWAELFTQLADRLIKQKDPLWEKVTSGSEVTPQQNKSRTRRAVFRRDRCCQWKSGTGEVCGSTFQLQIDHIQPVWSGGQFEISNLRLLCAQHNREKYRREAGVRRV